MEMNSIYIFVWKVFPLVKWIKVVKQFAEVGARLPSGLGLWVDLGLGSGFPGSKR